MISGEESHTNWHISTYYRVAMSSLESISSPAPTMNPTKKFVDLSIYSGTRIYARSHMSVSLIKKNIANSAGLLEISTLHTITNVLMILLNGNTEICRNLPKNSASKQMYTLPLEICATCAHNEVTYPQQITKPMSGQNWQGKRQALEERLKAWHEKTYVIYVINRHSCPVCKPKDR